jgi:hypothetical protein
MVKVYELIEALQKFPQNHQVVIKVPDGNGFLGAPCYCSFEITDLATYVPDNGELGIYYDKEGT